MASPALSARGVASQVASSSSSSQQQQHQRLQQAASTVKNFADQDAHNVDLADYLSASINQPYRLHLSAPWAPLKKVRTLTIPDAVIQATSSPQSSAAQGLFPEIERAWITIDNQLYLWRYTEGSASAFESYVHPSDVIQSVSLVTPKAGVFIETIQHLLVISTQNSVTLLGLAFETTPPPNVQKELRLYQTDFTLQTMGVVMQEFVATRDGSRLFCRGSDACLYELTYQSKEGWFSSKCAFKNLTSGGVKNLLPGWAGGVNKETMDILSIDHSRNLLYILHLGKSISVYSIPTAANQLPQLITTLKDIHRTASLIAPNNASLLRKEEFAIVSLQPIRSEESRTVSLLATTSNGVRLYFTNQRSGYRAFTTPASSLGGTASTLELLYVRAPPASGLAPTPTPQSTAAAGFHNQTDHPPAQPPLQNITHAIYKDGLFLAAGLFALESGFDNIFCLSRSTNTSTILSNTAVSAGSSGGALVPSTTPSAASGLADPAEQATDILVQGTTWALAEVPHQGHAEASLNPLVRQMTSLPRTFLVLTSTGLTVLVENRPVDLLRDLLERTSVAAGSANAESVGLVELFKRHGQAQSCAMALAIATRNSHLPLSLDSLLSVNPSSSTAYPAQMLTAESLLHATRVYFDYGGVPRYESPPYPHQPISEGRVVLSGRHDGFGVYFSRLIGSLWSKQLKTLGGGIGMGSPAAITGKDLTELRAFTASHAEAFGLGSKSSNGGSVSEGNIGGHGAASSEGDALAQRSERESLRSLVSLLERSIEALSFVVLIGDFGWDRVLAKVGPEVKARADSMKFSDLILEESRSESSTGASQQQQQQGQAAQAAQGAVATVGGGASQDASKNVSRALVEALIDLHSTTSPNGMDVIAELLQSRCSSFCNANDVRLYKALERIRQAKESPAGPQREEMLRESESLMMKAGSRLSFERLSEVVRLWKEMDWVGAAVHLPLKCVAEWDPHGFARSYRQDGMPNGDAERKAAYDRAMQCYGLVLDLLKDLDDKVDTLSKSNAPNAAALSRVENLRSTAYAITQQSPDALLHEALYDFLLASGRREQLLELRTVFLEGYLQQEPLTLEKLEMLWQCYTRRGEGASAARVLVGLAESTELDLTLFQRLEYLTLACNNAKSATVGGSSNGNGMYDGRGQNSMANSGYASVAFVGEIEEKLEVAQVQVEVYRAVGECEDLDEERRAIFLEDLDSGLLDISTLYRDFADPLDLYDVKILIFHVSDFRDSDLVASTWENILDRAHGEGVRLLSPERAYERVESVVVELGRRFANSDSAYPVDVLVRNLEAYALTQKDLQSIPSGWSIHTLLASCFAYESIFDTLDSLYESKMEPWSSNRVNTIFLINDILTLISSWLSSNTKGNIAVNRIDTNLNNYLILLDSFKNQAFRNEDDEKLFRDTLNTIKVLQDRLRSIW
ncbi:unnamed protein product [Sympodiomycopsis kandeliae]